MRIMIPQLSDDLPDQYKRLDLLRWYIDRSDRLRASYATRATNTLHASAS